MTTQVRNLPGNSYIINPQTKIKLADKVICKFCNSNNTVKNGIVRGNRQRFRCNDCGKDFRQENTRMIRQLNFIKPSKDQLEQWYNNDKISMCDIAKKVGCSYGSIKQYMIKYGIPRRTSGEHRHRKVGSSSPCWKGGRSTSKGYVLIYDADNPRSNKRHYIFEHIAIWEKVNNKILPKGWVIHHLNGIKNDNRPENLVALSSREHLQLLSEKAKRIRELEAQIDILEGALRVNVNNIEYGGN